MGNMITASAGERTRPIYAIGDIHGMGALLEALLDKISADRGETPATLVFLGDAVDRGPDTRGVLDRLMRGPEGADECWVVLRGNHDQLMLDALRRRTDAAFAAWIDKGGAETLASYGVARADLSLPAALAAVPSAHVEFLDGLAYLYDCGGHVFVHAGIDPCQPLARQSPQTMMNIRDAFHREAHRLPFTVVHGHAPTDGAPLVAPGRIDVDTGAHATGVLTAVALRPGRAAYFLEARGATAAAGR